MKREADLTRQLASLQTLREAVTAMKSLSAHHFRETRATLEPERAYRQEIDRVVRSTGATLPAGAGAVGLLVLGPELGLCGGYGSHVVDLAFAQREQLGPGPTFAVGHRGAIMLARRGLAADRRYAAPTSIRGLTEALIELSRAVIGDYLSLGLSRFVVVSSRFGGVGNHPPTVTSLLPLDATPAADAPPVRYSSAEAANMAAARELLYITIHGLLLDAMASEHAARLLATQAAEQWLDERTEHLRRGLSSARREASTQEVVEIAAGARARTRGRARAVRR